LGSLKPREVESAIVRAGWKLDRQKGSHRIYKHPSKPGIVVIPFTQKEIYPKLLVIIVKQAGLTREEFKELL
jgi:predicted RNA binding protein YcfA (HicA-like mRNA interferase family)